MHIFAATLATETNTFSPFPTGLDAFNVIRSRDVEVDPKLINALGPLAVWHRLSQQGGHEITLGLMAFAQPAGKTVRSVYEELRDEILTDLKAAGPVDIVLLTLHGAMVADGYDDCEGDLIRRVREIVGSEVIIGVELDLHCHFTSLMIEQSDLIICFKEYPHVDVNYRAEELFELAVKAQQGVIVPTMALFDCKIMGMYSTVEQPMRGFVNVMMEAERLDKVLSVSLGHGFPWGDVPEAGGKMLVVTDDCPQTAADLARELGLEFFSLREQVVFNSLPLQEALSQAVASELAPVVVADQSDNAGGGAPADSTFALEWLLKHQVDKAAVAIVYDPVVVQVAKSAGEGALLQVRLGGKMGPQSGTPLDLTVTVLGVRENYHHLFPQQKGEPVVCPIGDTVALRCDGVDIIVSSERSQCFSPCIFEDFGLNPRQYEIIIAKSTQHFHGAFSLIAGEIIYMAAPGAIVPIMQDIPYQHMETVDKYPWNRDPFSLNL